MKLIISTLVVGIVLFMLGGLFFSVLFADYFKLHFGPMMRSENDFKLWAFAVGSIIRAFFMYIIYSKGYQGGSPFFEGLKFGIYISLFYAVPYVFFEWGGSPVHYQPVVIDGVIEMAMLTIAGTLTGIIHGRKKAAA
jgi:hypothetical protein